MKLTERDKKLLLMLAYFVVIVGFGAFVFKPLINYYMEMEDKIVLLTAQKEEMDAQIQAAAGLQQRKSELSDLFLVSTEDLYPMLQSQDVDKEITGIVLSCGMQALNLNIEMPEEPVALIPYLYAEESAAEALPGYILPDEDVTETDEAEDDETEAEESEDYSQGYIYAPVVTMTASGSKAQVEDLIDTLTRDYPAIRIRAYSRQQESSILEEYDVKGTEVLSLELELYMCDRSVAEQEDD